MRVLGVFIASVMCSMIGMVYGWQTTLARCAEKPDLWCINGKIVNGETSAASGLLVNSRMIQGVFDDANSSTVSRWVYPDTGIWDAARNTRELVSNLSSYGLNAITVGFQGGGPILGKYPEDQPWVVSAWSEDGKEIEPSFAGRMQSIIEEADRIGMGVIVQLFYHGQSDRVAATDEAVHNVVKTAVNWLVSIGKPTNVIVDLANEANVNYHQPILSADGIAQAIVWMKEAAWAQGYPLLVSTSFTGGFTPPNSTLEVADFVLVHCNGMHASDIAPFLANLRAHLDFQRDPRPILFNECSTDLDVFRAAIQAKAGWGFYDQGNSTYHYGFQSPPVDWSTHSTPIKQAFFHLVKYLTAEAQV